MRSLLALAILLAVALGGGDAAAQDEDQRWVCPMIPPQLAKTIAAEAKGRGHCNVSCQGCGCKGGPGFRGPNGCVGWADLNRVCGPPPHIGCTRECHPVRPGCLGRSWVRDIAAKAGLAIVFMATELKHAPSGEPIAPELEPNPVAVPEAPKQPIR